MKNVFPYGHFSKYKGVLSRSIQIAESRRIEYSKNNKITVFISHKHDDLNDLAALIDFLETRYNVESYIDSDDPQMPQTPNEETAKQIKHKIKSCNKFLLLATDKAIQSKWCNWELGFGDAQKFEKNNIALIPMSNNESSYIGNEYLKIYPHIVECTKDDMLSLGLSAEPGYYVKHKTNDEWFITPLSIWLEK